MFKKLFNFLAQEPKRQYTLGSLISTGGEATPPLSVTLNRTGRFIERGITLTGVFLAVSAFVATPVLAAVPALVGTAAIAKGAGFAAGFFADLGARRAAGL